MSATPCFIDVKYLTSFIKYESNLCGLGRATVKTVERIAPQPTTPATMAESTHNTPGAYSRSSPAYTVLRNDTRFQK